MRGWRDGEVQHFGTLVVKPPSSTLPPYLPISLPPSLPHTNFPNPYLQAGIVLEHNHAVRSHRTRTDRPTAAAATTANNTANTNTNTSAIATVTARPSPTNPPFALAVETTRREATP